MFNIEVIKYLNVDVIIAQVLMFNAIICPVFDAIKSSMFDSIKYLVFGIVQYLCYLIFGVV
jgi:hypothetical protein